MSKDLLAIDADEMQLPAHLQGMRADPDTSDEWESGAAAGFPVLSIKGKVFHIGRGEEHELVTDPETGEQATGVNIVVLKTHKGVAKTYYAKTYEEGDAEAPTCYSLDGVAPDPGAEDRQAKKCAICPHNQFGSRITDSGGKGKACNDMKRLAVAPVGDLTDPMLLRLPPMTLKVWDTYVRMLAGKGLKPTAVITRISFNPSVAYPQLVFKAINFVTKKMVGQIEQALANPVIDSIIGDVALDRADSGQPPPPPEDDEDDDEDDVPPPPTKRKSRAKRKPAPVVEELDEEEDEDDEDEAPPPPPKRKPRRKKAAPPPPPEDDEEDDEEAEDDDLGELDFDDIDFGDDDD